MQVDWKKLCERADEHWSAGEGLLTGKRKGVRNRFTDSVPDTFSWAQQSQLSPATAASQNAGRLVFDHATQSWISNNGLIYGQGSLHGNRVLHVLAHLTPNPSNPSHTVFIARRNELIGLLDEAWATRGSFSAHSQSGNWNFQVPMGRVVGTNGETAITISVRPGTTEIMTAFPVP